MKKPIAEPVRFTGQILQRVSNERGGFYIVFSAESEHRRYRADAKLFAPDSEVALGTTITFEADPKPPNNKRSLPRVAKVISEQPLLS